MLGKTLLATETATIEHIKLALGLPGGAKALPHAIRRWKEGAASEPDAFAWTLASPVPIARSIDTFFVHRVQEVMPGLARWVRWVYPLYEPVLGLVEKALRPQLHWRPARGSPYAPMPRGTNRALAEAVGLTPVWPGTQELLPPLHPPPALDVAGFFADDGCISGSRREAGRVATHLRHHVGPSGLRSGKLDIAPADPEHTHAACRPSNPSDAAGSPMATWRSGGCRLGRPLGAGLVTGTG